jgi:acyl-CoA reductase-like NAD-dependent aldehyde dehydrogenase
MLKPDAKAFDETILNEPLLNFIGGEWSAPKNNKWLEHRNPASGEIDCRFPDSNIMDVASAIKSSHEAAKSWGKLPVEERALFLDAVAAIIEAEAEKLAQIQSADQGSSLWQAQESISRGARSFRAQSRLLRTMFVKAVSGERSLHFTNRQPIGLVGLITPWMDAFAAICARLAPALAAGNAVICKPSRHAPQVAASLAEILNRVSLAQAKKGRGIASFIHGKGESVGQALAAHPGITTLSFTGTTDNGRQVALAAAEFLKRTHLSLGARNPMLVFAENPLEQVVEQVIESAFLQSHSPLRGSRLFIQESIYPRFLELFKEATQKLMQSEAEGHAERRLGPLPHFASAQAFHAATELALSERAKLLFGEELRQARATANEPTFEGRDYFVQPTALFDLTLCSTLQQQEIAGPFVTISSFKYQNDAIKQANTSQFSKLAYVFCSDVSKALRVAKQLEFSQVLLNSGSPGRGQQFVPEVNPVGQKSSGWGGEGSLALFCFFSREGVITLPT